MKYLLTILLLLIAGNGWANDYHVELRTPQGCIIDMTNRSHIFISNPDECPDKDFVRYLNCFDQNIRPVKERSTECQ